MDGISWRMWMNMKERNTPNTMVRRGIEEIMVYGKDYDILEIKEMLLKEKGLVFGKDYTEGNISSALYILSNTGILIKTNRGVYRKAYNKDYRKKDSKEYTDENCSMAYEVKEVLGLFQENKKKIEEILEEICAALKNEDLSNGAADSELEALKGVLTFKEALIKMLEKFD